jgi:hypothetical protein
LRTSRRERVLRVATAFVWSGCIFHLEGKGKLKDQVETLEKKLEDRRVGALKLPRDAAGVAEAMERKRPLDDERDESTTPPTALPGSPNAPTQSTRSDLSGLSASGGKEDGRLVQPHSLFEFSVSLPRACLGKMISFR